MKILLSMPGKELEYSERTDRRRWDRLLSPTYPPHPTPSLPHHSWREVRHSPVRPVPVDHPNRHWFRLLPVFVPRRLRPLLISTACCAHLEDRDTRYSISCLLRNRLIWRTRRWACAVLMVPRKMVKKESTDRSFEGRGGGKREKKKGGVS